jgi:hypothetical protein
MCKKCGFAGVWWVGVEHKTLFLSIVWMKKSPLFMAGMIFSLSKILAKFNH